MPKTHANIFASAVLVFASFCSPCLAQLPAVRLQGAFPSGGQPGTSFEVELIGSDLDNVDAIIFDVPGITAERVMTEADEFYPEPRAVEKRFKVSIDASVPVGFCEIRCHGLYGWSNPARFLVSPLPQVSEQDNNDEQSGAQEISLPTLFHGKTQGGADVDWLKFQGSQGDRLTVEGISSIFESPVQLSVTLLDEHGIECSRHFDGVQGDACLAFTLPRNGTYALRVHDTTYRDGADRCYALRIGSFPIIVSAFPPSVAPGQSSSVTIYGFQLPGGSPGQFSINGQPLEEVSVNIAMPAEPQSLLLSSGRVASHQSWIPAVPFDFRTGSVTSTPVRVAAATAPVVQETQANDTPETAQPLTWPCEVAGRWYPQADVDWYTFEAHAGDEVVIDVVSHRLGVPTDPSLYVQQVIRSEDGMETTKDIVFMDDIPDQTNNFQRGFHEFDARSNDPSYLLSVPEDGTYRVMVRDSLSSVRSDVKAAYTLAIRSPTPGFELVAIPGDSHASWMLRKGGREYLRVLAFRRDGFDGEIRASVEGLVDGISADEITIGPGNTFGTIVVTCGDNTPPVQCRPTVIGKAAIGDTEITRRAHYGAASQPFQFNQPNASVASVPARLTSPPLLCVSETESAPVTITLDGEKNIAASRGSVLKIPYKVRRTGEIGGNLIAFPMNLPQNSQGNQVNLDGESGEFEVRFQANSPPGIYTFYLAGFLQNMQYRQNPEAADLAEADQKRITEILTQAQQAQRDAQTEAQRAAQDLVAAENRVTAARNAEQQATNALTAATNTTRSAMTVRDAAQTASQANPSDENAKAALAAATVALEQVITKQVEAEKAMTSAMNVLAEATKLREEAKRTKEVKDTASQQAQAFAQLAQQKKQQTDQSLQTARQAANPRNRNEHVPSNTITVSVAEFPLTMTPPSEPPVLIASGEKVAAKVIIERLFGFTGSVSLQLIRPGELGAIQVGNVNIPDGQNEGTFEMSANGNAPVGTHEITLRAQLNFNGQNLTSDESFTVKVDPPATESGQ